MRRCHLWFNSLYHISSAASSSRVLKGLAAAGPAAPFKLTYPDGTSNESAPVPAVKMDAGTLNGALTFSCTMVLQSDIKVTNPA